MNCGTYAPRDEGRELVMVALFKAGQTLQAIGDTFNLTRERVRQLLKRHGVTGKDGGITVSNSDDRYRGYTKEEFKEIQEKFPDCVRRFREQRNSATHHRGIEWKLTFKEWISVWDGHWDKRGRGHGLVMCRRKDKGAYELGNVFIAPGSFNNSAYQIRRHHGVDIDDEPYFTRVIS